MPDHRRAPPAAPSAPRGRPGAVADPTETVHAKRMPTHHAGMPGYSRPGDRDQDVAVRAGWRLYTVLGHELSPSRDPPR